MEDFPDIELFPRLTKIGQFIGRILGGPHLLSPVSEHFQHPLDSPIEPVTHMPTLFEGDGV